jgi:hypothetical protein
MRYACVGFILGLWLFTGCGSGEPNTYRVTGDVTWQGSPIADGDIIFTPQDGAAAPQAGKIVAGHYDVRATQGPNRIEIYATRESSQSDPVMNAKPREQFIPGKYNSQSTLSASVQAADNNRFDFNLQ